MKKKLPLFFLFIIISVQITAQASPVISGHVYRSKTSIPLEGVNVFIAGTLMGSSTDKSGYFEVKNIPKGNHQLVVSMIGFKSISKSISVKENSNYTLDFSLDEKPIEIDSITIIGEVPEEWFKQLDLFKEKFLGKNNFAKQCIIENELEINFSEDENNNLSALIGKPLIVINNALGYKLECELLKFTCNKGNNDYTYLIQPKFTELNIPKNKIEQINENRRNTYLGSMTHFVRSLINDSWKREGYWLEIYSNPKVKVTSIPVFKTESIFGKSKFTDKYRLLFTGFLRIEYNSGEIVSWIKLLGDEVLFDGYGYPVLEQSYIIFGDWSNYGVSKLLPRYSNFEEDK